MKAYYSTDYGGPEKSKYGNFPDPRPGPDQLLIEIKAVSLNPVDYKKMRGANRPYEISDFPRIFGTDYSGIVSETGNNVKGFIPGDWVYGMVRGMTRLQGTLAELAVADESMARKIPEGISFEDAASLPVAALTALAGARNCMVTPGKEVLVNGATGGVGHFAIQVAKSRGGIVTAICSPENSGLARLLGAVAAFGYRPEELSRLNSMFDAIIDAYGIMDSESVLRLIRPDGTYATTLPGRSGILGKYPSHRINGITLTDSNLRNLPEDYSEIENLVLGKKIHPVIENIFPLEKSSEAFRVAEFGKPRGKVIVRVPD